MGPLHVYHDPNQLGLCFWVIQDLLCVQRKWTVYTIYEKGYKIDIRLLEEYLVYSSEYETQCSDVQ